MSRLHRLIGELSPRQFTLMLILGIGGYTAYTTLEQRVWQERQLVQGTARLLQNLSASAAEQILTRNYSGLERTLLIFANEPEILALRVINHN